MTKWSAAAAAVAAAAAAVYYYTYLGSNFAQLSCQLLLSQVTKDVKHLHVYLTIYTRYSFMHHYSGHYDM